MECHSLGKCTQSDAIIHGPVLRQNYMLLFLCTVTHSDMFCVHQMILCCYLHHTVGTQVRIKSQMAVAELQLLKFDNILRIREGGAESNFALIMNDRMKSNGFPLITPFT